MWRQWVNFILGLWIVLSAFLNFTGAGITTNLVVVGIVVAVLSAWEALSYPSSMREHTHRHA